MRGLEPTIRRRPRRRTGEESGFTLIEVLVALSVFSLAVMALLNVQGQNTRTAGLVATRVVAGVVAENRAVEAVLGTTPLTMGVTEGRGDPGGAVVALDPPHQRDRRSRHPADRPVGSPRRERALGGGAHRRSGAGHEGLHPDRGDGRPADLRRPGHGWGDGDAGQYRQPGLDPRSGGGGRRLPAGARGAEGRPRPGRAPPHPHPGGVASRLAFAGGRH